MTVGEQAVANPAPPMVVPPRAGSRAETLGRLRYLMFGRAVPAALFGFVGYAQVQKVAESFRQLPARPSLLALASGPLPGALYAAFCVLPVAIYLTRPAPRARDGRLAPRAAAFTGTLMLLVVGAFFRGPPVLALPAAVRAIAAPLGVGALSLAVVGLLYLRRNLSIIPEARQLVTSGPYRWIRHPLYAAEIMTSFSLVLASPAFWLAVTFLPFVALQVLRAHYEEALLGASFPAYAAYSKRTWRMIPLVW